MKDHLFYYDAKVVSAYDGDTVRVDIDMGFKCWIKNEIIRLARINAPEIRGEERPQGLLSRDFLRGLILNKKVVLHTFKDEKGKYGRYLADIWIEKDGNWINVNDLMVSEGYAIYQDY